MGDRTILQIDEEARGIVHHRLRIERSAAGAPAGIVIVERHDGVTVDEASVVLEDLRVLQPVIDWAGTIDPRALERSRIGRPRPGAPTMRDVDRAIVSERQLRGEVEALRSLLARVRGMGVVSRYVEGDSLAAYIDGSMPPETPNP